MVRGYNYTLNSPTTLFPLNLPIRPSFQRDSTSIKQCAHSFAYFDCGWSVFLICLLIYSVSPSLSLFFFIPPLSINPLGAEGLQYVQVCVSTAQVALVSNLTQNLTRSPCLPSGQPAHAALYPGQDSRPVLQQPGLVYRQPRHRTGQVCADGRRVSPARSQPENAVLQRDHLRVCREPAYFCYYHRVSIAQCPSNLNNDRENESIQW